MEYRAIGIMSGSSLDGLDLAFVVFNEAGGKWTYEITHSACKPYAEEWVERLKNAVNLDARSYLLLHSAYGHYMGSEVNAFIEQNQLQHRVQVIGSHGHTTFHEPANTMTAQLGDGAAIAAATGINVVSDLRAMDVALGGQGAPIVPIGEQLLFGKYPLLLNIGGIANLSAALPGGYVAYDICPANRILNLLAVEKGLDYDAGGQVAASGFLRDETLALLNREAFYQQPYPKSLANDFGTDVLYPALKKANLGTADALRTMTEHIAIQVVRNVGKLALKLAPGIERRLLVTGGGAFNNFLIERIKSGLQPLGVTVEIPDAQTVEYKEALIMALLGVLRWRENNTCLRTVTGASRSSIGGAVWIGQDA